MRLILPWFRARQGSKARVVSYMAQPYFYNEHVDLQGGAKGGLGDSEWVESKSASWLDKGYPVIFSINLEKKSGHSVVATKYKGKSRRFRRCKSYETGWWWGRRTREFCSWREAFDGKFFLHYGWGGRNNKWQEVSPAWAHVAYLSG